MSVRAASGAFLTAQLDTDAGTRQMPMPHLPGRHRAEPLVTELDQPKRRGEMTLFLKPMTSLTAP